jgi:hypothetical protein
MEHYCHTCGHRFNPLKLLVTFRDRKLVALIQHSATCTEAIQTLNALVREIYPDETLDIQSLTVDGYVLPGKYLIGDICESGTVVEGKSAEIKKQKRHSDAPHTDPVKKTKRGEAVTPAPKVKFSSLFQTTNGKSQDKPSDPSDSDDSVFEVKSKPRTNVFRK